MPPWTDFKGLEMQTGTFTLKQIKAATDNFAYDNKIGEGGFGPVYKVIFCETFVFLYFPQFISDI